jgi:two-component system CheB/CheR fusion protein
MAREGLRQELILALPKALRTAETVHLKNLAIEGDGETQSVDLTVHPLTKRALSTAW